MKRVLCFFILAVSTTTLSANAIDRLKTTADVVNFLYKIDAKLFKQNDELIKFLPVDSIFNDSLSDKLIKLWHVKSWEKVDFNHDGHTDLLIQPHWPYITTAVIMDQGNNTFKVFPIFKYMGNEIARPLKLNGEQLLLFRHFKNAVGLSSYPRIDTLVFKYGSFIEYQAHPSTTEINSISMETNMCYGICPVFKLEIYSNGKATYYAKKFNPKQGNFSATIYQDKLNQLMGLVKYIDVKALNDEYNVGWTDDQTAFLIVNYADGSAKVIEDYGLAGTFGLKRLYELLSELRTSQAWHKQ